MEDKTTAAPPDAWAIVELMGHVRIAGRISEVEKFGVKMGRLDIPTPDGLVTQLFGGGSVYRITLVSEEAARLVALHNAERPVHSWEMPRPALPPKVDAGEAGRFEYSDSEDDPDKIGY